MTPPQLRLPPDLLGYVCRKLVKLLDNIAVSAMLIAFGYIHDRAIFRHVIKADRAFHRALDAVAVQDQAIGEFYGHFPGLGLGFVG